jgi:hypothetical protein
MGGVIVNGDDHWFVAGHEFRQLLAGARAMLTHEEHRERLVQAEAMQGLILDQLADPQLRRVVAAVDAAALELSRNSTTPRDEREADFREHLPALRELLARTSQ